MKKKLSLCIIILCQYVYGYVQTVSNFGVISPDELKIVDCAFDKNAEALVLFDIGKFSCFFYPSTRKGITTEFNRHIRIKILNQKGFEQANVKIPYYSSAGESIRNISAQTYNADASGKLTISRVEKAFMYDKKISNRMSEKSFAFPDVKEGSIIEFKYTVAEAGLHNWYFQKEIPVNFSSYTVDYPYDFEVLSTPLCSFPLEESTQKDKLRTVRSFTMKNIVPLRDEPYIGCLKDYLQKIESNILAVTTSRGRYNLMPGWPSIIKELMEDQDFGIQLKKDIPQTPDLELTLKNTADPYERMVFIHDYVRQNMEWNGYNNIWALNGVKTAWLEKKGTTGEINLILINLLKNSGLDVYPVLVSTQDNGKVYLERPGITQFNKILAYVKIRDKIYVLDATEKNTPSNLIPSEVLYTWSLILKNSKKNSYEWDWQILAEKEKQFKNTFVIQASINKDANISGEASIYSYDYARVSRQSAIKADSLKFLSDRLIGQSNQVEINSFSLVNKDVDTLPLIQNIRFTQPIATSGGYNYFSLNLFTGLDINPFTADSRLSDVYFGFTQQYNIQGKFTVPPGYSFEGMPGNISLAPPDSTMSITRIVELTGNVLSVNIILKFNQPSYPAERYLAFKEFFKKAIDVLNEKYVIKKSNT
jgi:hypothetical protein